MFKSVDCVTQIVKLIYLFYKSGTDESSQDESLTDARRNVKCGRNGRKSKPAGAGQLSLEELLPIFWEQSESPHRGRTQRSA